MVTEFLEILDAIPASFWGVIVGSFFSIGGIALTNRASDRRLSAQFEHERKLKTKDREMELRKEVYLAAAEAVSMGLTAIGRFANLDISNDLITALYVEKATAFSKLHVIAQIGTVKALSDFASPLGSLFFSLITQRYQLLSDRNAITIIDNQVTEFGKERDRILELIKQHNIEGIVDDRRWKVLQGNFDFEQERVLAGIARRGELAADLYPRHLEFMRECATHYARFSQLFIPFLLAVRAELELPLDELAYRDITLSALANQQTAIDEFIQRAILNSAQQINPRSSE